MHSDKMNMPSASEALPDRPQAMPIPERHLAHGRGMGPEFPDHLESAMFGMGCFWGAERLFWELEGVYSTQVGYAGGHTAHPSYEDVCSGSTGHTEVVGVIFDPERISYDDLLTVFWDHHNPTQGMRQGNDRGTQYRSAVYCFGPGQRQQAEASRVELQARLDRAGHGAITTEVRDAPTFYYAEPYHQQYLASHPNGYCGLGGIITRHDDEVTP